MTDITKRQIKMMMALDIEPPAWAWLNGETFEEWLKEAIADPETERRYESQRNFVRACKS